MTLPAVRVQPEIYASIKEKQTNSGLDYAEFVRRSLSDRVVVVRNSRENFNEIRALAAIGNNLNQIARSANIHGGIDRVNNERLHEVLPALQKLLDELISNDT